MKRPLKKSAELVTFLKFSLVGALNTGVDYGVFLLLFHLFALPYLVAHIVSYSCGVVNSYLWNKFWTFRVTGRFTTREALVFLLVNLAALLLAGLTLGLFVEILKFSETAGKVCAIPVSLLINFLGNRFFVFTVGRDTARKDP